jgi:tetratricopeptide (TPR) repeat protein
MSQAPVGQSSAFGMTNSATVSITVYSSKGVPVGDARVELKEISTGQPVKSGYTNSMGHLDLNDVPFGSYEVVATRGVVEARENAQIRALGASVSLVIAEDRTGDDTGNKSTVSVAQFKVPGKARKEYNKAKEALIDRKIDETEKHLAKALEIFPNFAEALTLRGIVALDRDDLEAANRDVQQAITLDPTYPTAYFVMGAALNLQSRFDDAVRSLERGLALDPSGWQGYFEMGKAKIGKQDYRAAIKYMDKAQLLAPQEYSHIHLVKAHALLALKIYPEAMDELQKFLDKSPKDPQSQDVRKTLEQVRAFAGK